MSAQGLESLDRSVQLTNLWINDLNTRLSWNDKARSYRLLKSVLHALRDSLGINETSDLGAQLPVLLRGAYYEQWRPTIAPVGARNIDEFLARVNDTFKCDPLANPFREIMTVLEFLTDKITEGGTSDVKRSLPRQIQSVWPKSNGG